MCQIQISMQSRLGKNNERKREWAAKGFLVLGPFTAHSVHSLVSFNKDMTNLINTWFPKGS